MSLSKTPKFILVLLCIASFVFAKETNEEQEFLERLKEAVNELDAAMGENKLEERQILNEWNYFDPLENEIEKKIYPAILKKLLFIKDDCSNLDKNISKVTKEFSEDSNSCEQVLNNLKFQNEAVFQKAKMRCDWIIRTKIIPKASDQYVEKCDSLKHLDKYSNNKLHLIHSIKEPPCKLSFKLVNKTNLTLSKNSIVGLVVSPSEEAQFNLSFEKLKPNDEVAVDVIAGKYTCGQTIARIGFSDINNAIKDGIKSYDIIEASTKTGLDIKWRFNYDLGEAIKLKNPLYRAKKEKINSCLDNCQKRMEACVMRYMNSGAANEICGMPHFGCLNGCNSIK